MRVPFFDTKPVCTLVARFMDWALSRPANVIIGGIESPYLVRRYLIPRNRILNIYFHQFLRSDDDRALHDHPWWNVSILLYGSYREFVACDWNTSKADPEGFSFYTRNPGDIVLRSAKSAHRIELLKSVTSSRELPAITLFVTGPTIREWGFYCQQGWKHWKDFTAFRKTGSGNTIGPGCGEDDA